jgi:hypothetical protein
MEKQFVENIPIILTAPSKEAETRNSPKNEKRKTKIRSIVGRKRNANLDRVRVARLGEISTFWEKRFIPNISNVRAKL